MTTEHAQACDFEAQSATTEQHEMFKPFEGTFRAEVKMWMGPGDPMISTGTMVNTLELGGRFLSQQYTGDATDGPFPNFEGRGFWGYNTQRSKWEGVWIDTASTVMQTETGDLDAAGKVWTMHGEAICPEGTAMPKRSVITLIDNDHHTMEMYFTPPGCDEMKGMEISYARKR